MNQQVEHYPVLLNEILQITNPAPGEKVIDATIGRGGHTLQFLERIKEQGFLLGIDADPEAVEKLNKAVSAPNFKAVQGNFRDLDQIAEQNKGIDPDIIIFDLGYSTPQLKDVERGLSFQQTGPLDMRLDPQNKLTAAQILNQYSEKELFDIFKEYGEERNARRLAALITEKRKTNEFGTTEDLTKVIDNEFSFLHPQKLADIKRRIFQSLRIEVNDELNSLKIGLKKAFDLLSKNGRMAVISFHSLEDRIVKSYFRHLANDCVCPPEAPVCVCDKKSEAVILTKKPIIPSNEEIKTNPPSSSAKMRAIQKL